MTPQRWHALMTNHDLRLSPEELQEGWHWCYDWDGLLVGPGMPEWQFCHCRSRNCLAPDNCQE